MEKKTKQADRKVQEGKKSKIVETPKNTVGSRGRIFEGIVVGKFNKRVSIAFERMIYIRKYERYARSRTKIHARLPEHMEKEINKGDLIQIRECRPLSKIIHFIVTKKIKNAEDVK